MPYKLLSSVFVICQVISWPRGRVVRSAVFMVTCEYTGSTLISVTLLRPWERRFAIVSSAWWILTSSKFLKVNNNYYSIGVKELTTPKWVCIILILCITPPPFSREWKINAKLSIYLCIYFYIQLLLLTVSLNLSLGLS